MRNSDDSSSPSLGFIQSIDSIEKDERELDQNLSEQFRNVKDVSAAWDEVVQSEPVTGLLKELLPKSILVRWSWERSRETTAEYLQYHFKYALLRDEATLASSRNVITSHLKNAPTELVTGALDHVEKIAALVRE